MAAFGSMPIGQYYPAESPVHRLDSRVKIVLALALTVAVFLVQSFISFALLAAAVIVLVSIGRLPWRVVIRGLRPLVYILAFTVAIHLLTTAGPSIEVGWLRISREGLRTGAFVTVRLILLVLGTSLLTLTSTPVELTDGLEYLLGPLKRIGVPAHEIAMMMTIALRFIPTLVAETDKIVKAQMARGAEFERGNPVKRARSFIPVLVPLFVGVFRRADELAIAMESRCYRGGDNRTRLRELRMRPVDWAAGLCFSLVLAALVIVGRVY